MLSLDDDVVVVTIAFVRLLLLSFSSTTLPIIDLRAFVRGGGGLAADGDEDDGDWIANDIIFVGLSATIAYERILFPWFKGRYSKKEEAGSFLLLLIFDGSCGIAVALVVIVIVNIGMRSIKAKTMLLDFFIYQVD